MFVLANAFDRPVLTGLRTFAKSILLPAGG